MQVRHGGIAGFTGACLIVAAPALAQDMGAALSNSTAQAGVRTTPSLRLSDPQVAPNALLGPVPLDMFYRGGTYFSRDRNVAAAQRQHTELAPNGIRVGPFVAVPNLELLTDYNDNVFARENGRQDDGIIIGRAEVEALSDLPRHQISLLGRVQRNEYLTFGTESFTSYLGRAGGRLDVQHNVHIYGDVGYSKAIEPRIASGAAVFVRRPIRYNSKSADLSAVIELTRVRFRGTFNYNGDRFNDGEDLSGARVEQNFRDINRIRATARAEYALTPDKSIFVEAALDRRRYPNNNVGERDRTGNGYEITLGSDFDLSALIRGTLQAGYLNYNFRNRRFSDVSGPGIRGRVEYFLSGLTTVGFTITRSIQDSGLAESSGFIDFGGAIRVDHELFRNVLLHVQGAYDNNRFRGVDRRDNRYGADIGFEYRLDRQWAVKGTYNLILQRSNGANLGANYDVNDVTIGVSRHF